MQMADVRDGVWASSPVSCVIWISYSSGSHFLPLHNVKIMKSKQNEIIKHESNKICEVSDADNGKNAEE